MILINCSPCGQRHLVSNSRVQSLHTTEDGLLGYISCPESGATLVHNFTTSTTIGELKDATMDDSISAPVACDIAS